MRILLRSSSRGMALFAVMIAIFVLSVLVGAFAYSMKVETRLAMNANNESEVLWLGRSGVEYARWVLAEQLQCPNEHYDSLNQVWAGGPGGACTNSGLTEVQNPVQLGGGQFRWKITDLESKVNINLADEPLLRQAFTLVGVDASAVDSISSSILDWIDPDDSTHLNGTESSYYQSLNPPYYAKNGPMDDISELLLVRGVTQNMYWGPASTNHSPATFQVDRFNRPIREPNYPVGLVQIFTALSDGRINVNTASSTVLQVIPGIDEHSANQIIQLRAGPDGVDGTEDDTPFSNVGELGMAVDPSLVPMLQRYCDVRSRTFRVEVDAEVNGYHKTFYAILGRVSPRDVQILSFYWK